MRICQNFLTWANKKERESMMTILLLNDNVIFHLKINGNKSNGNNLKY